jgi:hypothetical protein
MTMSGIPCLCEGQFECPTPIECISYLRTENERLRTGPGNPDDAAHQLQRVQELRAENERLRAALTEIMQGARSVDYAIHVARVALGNAKE